MGKKTFLNKEKNAPPVLREVSREPGGELRGKIDLAETPQPTKST